MKHGLTLLLGVFSASLAVGCGDPVVSDAVAALGGEAPNVRHGPLHRPGQPCTLCHDGTLGNPGEFSVAGTVFLRPSSTQGVNKASVEMTDSQGVTFIATTNAAGNFYVNPNKWTPSFPIVKTVVRGGGAAQPAVMYSETGRSASCATCHFDPAGPTSPGHIALENDDGSAPL
jgi:hypothetical protein